MKELIRTVEGTIAGMTPAQPATMQRVEVNTSFIHMYTQYIYRYIYTYSETGHNRLTKDIYFFITSKRCMLLTKL